MSSQRPAFGYGGMTVNERLGAAGLLDKFDAAIQAGDRDQAVRILQRVDMTEESAAATVDAVLADPARYGYPRHSRSS